MPSFLRSLNSVIFPQNKIVQILIHVYESNNYIYKFSSHYDRIILTVFTERPLFIRRTDILYYIHTELETIRTRLVTNRYNLRKKDTKLRTIKRTPNSSIDQSYVSCCYKLLFDLIMSFTSEIIIRLQFELNFITYSPTY